jgi:hypothetical protein
VEQHAKSGAAPAEARRRPRRIFAANLLLVLASATPTLADDASTDPLGACGRAAAHAEAEWYLPAGLLAAIGTVESGRGGLGSTQRVAWPWSINAGGRGLYVPSKAAAVMTVRSLQAAGLRTIDVGCFQVDLFYHPEAFATLDAAFDPETNSRAAARILTQSRFGGRSWEVAIALYHSASVTRGARYLQQVQAVWPWARVRSAVVAEDGPTAYAVLLSPAARLVRVVTEAHPPPGEAADLPRVLGPQDSAVVLQWAADPRQTLPLVLAPEGATRRGSARRYPSLRYSLNPQ